MCEVNQNSSILVGKYIEHDIRRTQTKLLHVKSGGKEYDKSYPEEEECCSCLEKGKHRRCCKKFYCHTCYYNESRECPGCGVAIHRSGASVKRPKPKKISVLATWGITLFVSLMVVGGAIIFIYHNYTRTETIWKGTCYGWFPTCDRHVCIEVGSNETLIPINYRFCSIDHTINKIVGRTCIIDPQLYYESEGHKGFDICLTNDMGDYMSSNRGMSHEFENSVIVFEDDFDYWRNRTDFTTRSVMMKSARWSNMVNAETDDICGMNQAQRPHEDLFSPSKNELIMKSPSALVFSGVRHRYAETIDLDISFGGKVEFYLKLAPIVENELASECKSAFGGDVQLVYSLDHGLSWVVLKIYPVWKYRDHIFTYIKETIPFEAQSNHTRFRWEQPYFDPIRDFWALDDVRILHTFEYDWSQSFLFEERIQYRAKNDQNEQCYIDTEQCLEIPNYSKKNCNPTENDPIYRLKIADLFILSAIMVCCLKKAFRDYRLWVEVDELSDEADTRSMLLQHQQHPTLKTFPLNISKTWQVTCFTLCNMPFLACFIGLWWHILVATEYYGKNSIQSFICILALGLDFWVVRSISMNVLQCWPCNIQSRIYINKSYDDFKLWIDDEAIDILDISNIELHSQSHYCIMFVFVILSSLPIATMSIMLKLLHFKYEIYIIILEILGCCLLIRSIVGPLWAVEIYLSTTWIFSFSSIKRDEMGRAIERPSVRHIVSNCLMISMTLYITLLLSFKPLRNSSLLIKVVIFFAVSIIGSVIGALLGMLRGLPIASSVCLTTWPSEGYTFVHDRCALKPYLWSRVFGGGMNSCRLHMFQVAMQQEFKLLISGKNGFNDSLATNQVNMNHAGSRRNGNNLPAIDNAAIVP